MKVNRFFHPLCRSFCSTQSPTKHVLVYGGSGALGRSIVDVFKNEDWNATSIDFSENESANNSIVLSGIDWSQDTEDTCAHLQKKSQVFDVIVNAGGGWVGGTIKDPNVFDAFNTSFDQNVKSAVSAAHLAASLLSSTGILVLTGAAPIHTDPLSCAGMLAYGSAKASVHFLVKSLADQNSGLPIDSNVIGILPTTIDTPGNRAAMPSADFDAWTRPSVFAKCIVNWARESSEVSTTSEHPKLINGQLYEFKTIKNGKSITDFVDTHEVDYRYKG